MLRPGQKHHRPQSCHGEGGGEGALAVAVVTAQFPLVCVGGAAGREGAGEEASMFLGVGVKISSASGSMKTAFSKHACALT
jgi:hypothetical protein